MRLFEVILVSHDPVTRYVAARTADDAVDSACMT
jgi:hypothetical protein